MKRRSLLFYFIFALLLLHLCVYGKDIMDRNDLNLKIEFFSASGKADQLDELKEKKLTFYQLDTGKSKDINPTGQILNIFGKKIDKVEQFATYNTDMNPDELAQVKWIRAGFLIGISVPGNVEPESPRGSFFYVEAFNFIDNFKIKEKIKIVENKPTLAVTRNKDKILFLLFRFNKKAQQYHSIFYFDGFVISTMKEKWNEDDFSKQVMVFPESKAEFKDKGIVLVSGNITYDKKKNRLIGEKAKVFDRNGKIIGEGDKIIVPINNPRKIEILK